MTGVLALLTAFAVSDGIVLENEYVRVARNQAPCAAAPSPGCGDRLHVVKTVGDRPLRNIVIELEPEQSRSTQGSR